MGQCCKKFNERKRKDYDKGQLKNQLGVLKKEWQLWQNLDLGESELGRDPDTGSITTSEEWWDLKLMVFLTPNLIQALYCNF